MHEARLHDDNMFITLTYDAEHLPRDGGLRKRDFVNFMKRLRKHAAKPGIKFFQCGEYGEEFKRPHYHALIFGFDVPDRKLWKMSNDIPVFSSVILDDIWGQGFTSVGNVTWQSAAYCARYTLKKINGALREKPDPVTGLLPYERCHLDTGEVVEVEPEYATMSRGGRDGKGLGYGFLKEFVSDIYPEDQCIVNGHPTRPPRYYDHVWEAMNPDSMEEIKERRVELMNSFAHDNTRARLKQRRKVKEAQISQLPRGDL